MSARHFYESSADRSKERAVIDVFGSIFNVKPVKLKPSLIVDFGLIRGDQIVGVAEVKVRGKEYPEMFISHSKVSELRRWDADGVKARIIFATPHGVYVKKVEGPHIDGWIGFGGRTDRGDPQDQEPVVFYKLDQMERIASSDPVWFQ